jgi:hypothetical protein
MSKARINNEKDLLYSLNSNFITKIQIFKISSFMNLYQIRMNIIIKRKITIIIVSKIIIINICG